MDPLTNKLSELYSERFSDDSSTNRSEIWSILCTDFFQRWIPADATVLDVAAGRCEFINHIQAARRIAIDLNPDVQRHAHEGVEVHITRSDELKMIDDASVDVVFASNFFEHITREAILSTLIESRRVLRPDGRFLLLQPNVRFCGKDYWQFFDHITPIDDRAMVEAFASTGYRVEKCIPRFLPYTTKSRLPTRGWMVRTYLRVPPVWRVLGAQSFMVAAPR